MLINLRFEELPQIKFNYPKILDMDFKKELDYYQKLADKFLEDLHAYPQKKYEGKGIVICAGGETYFTCAWVCINSLRRLGCTLPIELWYLDESEWSIEMEQLLTPFDVTCMEAVSKIHEYPAENLINWELKPYAILHSKFKEVLLLDADNFVVQNPEFLFTSKAYLNTGALFWPDRYSGDGIGVPWLKKETWSICQVLFQEEPEFETGQLLVDKQKCWSALNLAVHYNIHSKFYYRFFYGDKDTFHLAWRKLGHDYTMMPFKNYALHGDELIIQFDFVGKPLFQHRNGDKWSIHKTNKHIPEFEHEEQARNDLADLKKIWKGFRRKVPQEYNAIERQVFEEVVSIKNYNCFVEGKGHRWLQLMHDFKINEPYGTGNKWSIIRNGHNKAILKIKLDGRNCQLWPKDNGCWTGWLNSHGREIVEISPSIPKVDQWEVEIYQQLESQKLQNIPEYPKNKFQGKGLVIAGGGQKYFPCVWVILNALRKIHNCRLPIELWYLGPQEMSMHMKALVKPYGVTTIDALEIRKSVPCINLEGWELKPYAILNSRFKDILFLDVDNVPLRDPSFLFDSKQYRNTGAIFWPDFGRAGRFQPIWDICKVPYRDEPEFETGQMLIDKKKCWNVLQLTMFYNEHSNFYYRYINGDKETFHMAWRKLNQPYAMPPYPIDPIEDTMRQHDFEGNILFQHRNLDKWNWYAKNKRIDDFMYEKECFEYLKDLRKLWKPSKNINKMVNFKSHGEWGKEKTK